jgi:hypothetical protein
MLKAYRWQYIVSGVQDPRFSGIWPTSPPTLRWGASPRRWRR